MQLTNRFIYQQWRHGKVQVCAYASIYTIWFVSSSIANLDHYRELLKEVGKELGSLVADFRLLPRSHRKHTES